MSEINATEVSPSQSADSTARDLTEHKSLGKFTLGKLTFESALDKQAAKDQKARDSSLGDAFEPTWELYTRDSDGTRLYDGDTKWFLDRYAPEASDLYQIAKGENWFNELDNSEFDTLKRVTEHRSKAHYLAESILSNLNVTSEGQVRRPFDEEQRIQLIHTALWYDNERTSLEAELLKIANKVKSMEPEGATTQIKSVTSADIARRVDAIIEQRHKKRANTREIFARPPELSVEKSDARMDEELNQIMPSLLESAQMMSPEAEKRLLARLGVMKNRTDESYTIAANTRETEGQHAMWMVLNQRVRNKQLQERDRRVQELVLVGRLNEMANTEGADLLVLHALEMDSAKDCGRYFAELVRKEILRERINEMTVLHEQIPPSYQDLSEREIVKGAVKGLQEAYFIAEGVFNVMAKAVDSIFARKFLPGSFGNRVFGSISERLRKVGGTINRVNSEVPSLFPRTVRPAPQFPDLFGDFN